MVIAQRAVERPARHAVAATAAIAATAATRRTRPLPTPRRGVAGAAGAAAGRAAAQETIRNLNEGGDSNINVLLLTVQYSGDEDFSALTSAPIIHVVTKASSTGVVTTAVTSSLNPSIYGDTVTLSISVTSSVGIQPTGTVSVVDGANNLGTLTLNASGNASITIPVFTAGTHNIVVTYSGDSNYGN